MKKHKKKKKENQFNVYGFKYKFYFSVGGGREVNE